MSATEKAPAALLPDDLIAAFLPPALQIFVEPVDHPLQRVLLVLALVEAVAFVGIEDGVDRVAPSSSAPRRPASPARRDADVVFTLLHEQRRLHRLDVGQR